MSKMHPPIQGRLQCPFLTHSPEELQLTLRVPAPMSPPPQSHHRDCPAAPGASSGPPGSHPWLHCTFTPCKGLFTLLLPLFSLPDCKNADSFCFVFLGSGKGERRLSMWLRSSKKLHVEVIVCVPQFPCMCFEEQIKISETLL